MKNKYISIFSAILAAVLYAVNIPFSKILLKNISPTMMAALLYLGAGFGLTVYAGIEKLLKKKEKNPPLTKEELPFTIAMIVLDIAAPILLMLGIAKTNSANVSLLNNFEIVATSLIAFIIFNEVISKRLFIAITLVTVASIILTFEGDDAFTFNSGSLFVLGACICWGFENNCTKMLSNKSSTQIVIIKGLFSGMGSLIIALLLKEPVPLIKYILFAFVLGFISYGLSIKFYVMAQQNLGAAKTSAYYSITPLLGVAFSMLLLKERPAISFYIALAIMVISSVLMIKDNIALQHTHEHTHIHTHEHRHGDLIHTHEHVHNHTHNHIHIQEHDGHMHTLDELPEHHHSH